MFIESSFLMTQVRFVSQLFPFVSKISPMNYFKLGRYTAKMPSFSKISKLINVDDVIVFNEFL